MREIGNENMCIAVSDKDVSAHPDILSSGSIIKCQRVKMWLINRFTTLKNLDERIF